MFGIALVLIITVMGGMIAFIGDKLGTKVGKKKLSVFGLRPRHTSILVTIITGILIASSTLGVLALTSQDVRTALFGMKALQEKMANLSEAVASQNGELEASRTALEQKTQEYSAVSAKVADTQEKLKAISGELETVTAERDRTAAALDSVQGELSTATSDLTAARLNIASLEATKAQLEQKITTLTTAKENMQKDVDRLNELTANLRVGLQNVREGTVIYRSGEALGSVVLPGGHSDQDTAAALRNVVYDLNQDILSKLQVKDKTLEILWISQSAFEQAVQTISTAGQDMIVRISAADNTVYGEPVIGKLELFPNQLIYPAGALVYSAPLVPTTTQQQAEDEVLAFLQNVNEGARKQGVLPDPLQGTVGSISGAELYQAVDKVRHAAPGAELRAVTTETVYSAGPLRISIQVVNHE